MKVKTIVLALAVVLIMAAPATAQVQDGQQPGAQQQETISTRLEVTEPGSIDDWDGSPITRTVQVQLCQEGTDTEAGQVSAQQQTFTLNVTVSGVPEWATVEHNETITLSLADTTAQQQPPSQQDPQQPEQQDPQQPGAPGDQQDPQQPGQPGDTQQPQEPEQQQEDQCGEPETLELRLSAAGTGNATQQPGDQQDPQQPGAQQDPQQPGDQQNPEQPGDQQGEQPVGPAAFHEGDETPETPESPAGGEGSAEVPRGESFTLQLTLSAEEEQDPTQPGPYDPPADETVTLTVRTEGDEEPEQTPGPAVVAVLLVIGGLLATLRRRRK